VSASRRLAALVAMLLLLSAAAFVIGATIEKNQGHSDSSAEQAHLDESSEVPEHAEGEETESGESHSDESETIGGIDVESTPIIVLGAALSLTLAGAVLKWPRREVFVIVVVFGIGFAVLDWRELAHQLDENAATVATFAALALALHLGAAAVAALAAARAQGDRATPAAA
jgi:hypothetical protein